MVKRERKKLTTVQDMQNLDMPEKDSKSLKRNFKGKTAKTTKTAGEVQAQQKTKASSTNLQTKKNETSLQASEQLPTTDGLQGVLSSLHFDLETRWKKRVVSMSLLGRLEIFPNAGGVVSKIKRKAEILPVASIIEIGRGDKGVSQGVQDTVMIHLSTDQVSSILKMLGLL